MPLPVEETKYGFKWGPLEVARIGENRAEKSGIGVTIGLKTDRNADWIEVRVSPKGLVRVFGPDGREWIEEKSQRHYYRTGRKKHE